jgi:hypothetical protein
MFSIDLPSYTSERYYLLSEIEQHANFISLDYPEESSISDHRERYLAVYLLLDARAGNSSSSLLQHLLRVKEYIHKHINIPSANTILAVEVYHDQLDSSKFKEDIEKLYQEVSISWTDLGLLVFGISDNAAGTCALEVVMDYCTIVALEDASKIQLICTSKQSFLGLEVDIEPDAISGVKQYILASKPAPLSDWMKSVTGKRELFEDLRASTNTTMNQVKQYQPWTHILALVVLIVSVSLYLLARSS